MPFPACKPSIHPHLSPPQRNSPGRIALSAQTSPEKNLGGDMPSRSPRRHLQGLRWQAPPIGILQEPAHLPHIPRHRSRFRAIVHLKRICSHYRKGLCTSKSRRGSQTTRPTRVLFLKDACTLGPGCPRSHDDKAARAANMATINAHGCRWTRRYAWVRRGYFFSDLVLIVIRQLLFGDLGF